jgi:hypothetical protein
MNIVVINCTEVQARSLRDLVAAKLLTPENDPGGKYHGWYQVAGFSSDMELVRLWLDNNPVEHRFF